MTEVTAHLRGVNFRPPVAKEVVLALNVGDKLLLEREPSNKFDENAIRVLHPDEEAEDSKFLGFVAKEVAAVIAPPLLQCCSSRPSQNRQMRLMRRTTLKDELRRRSVKDDRTSLAGVSC